MLHCKNYSSFELDSSREIKKKIHIYQQFKVTVKDLAVAFACVAMDTNLMQSWQFTNITFLQIENQGGKGSTQRVVVQKYYYSQYFQDFA